MGNAHGGFLILAEEDFAENWDLYSSASWRSERVRELDALGGRQRPPVRRGQSFSLKADYIARKLSENREKMQNIVTKPKEVEMDQSQQKRFSTYSDRRAAEKRGEIVEEETVIMSFQGARAPSPGRAIGSARHRTPAKPPGRAAQAPTATVAPEPVSEWRLRVHAARRRTMLLIRTSLMFRRGHSGSHPVRLPRMDDLGFLVPIHLGADTGSFVRELLGYVATKKQVEELEEALERQKKNPESPAPIAQLCRVLEAGPDMSMGSDGPAVSMLTRHEETVTPPSKDATASSSAPLQLGEGPVTGGVKLPLMPSDVKLPPLKIASPRRPPVHPLPIPERTYPADASVTTPPARPLSRGRSLDTTSPSAQTSSIRSMLRSARPAALKGNIHGSSILGVASPDGSSSSRGSSPRPVSGRWPGLFDGGTGSRTLRPMSSMQPRASDGGTVPWAQWNSTGSKSVPLASRRFSDGFIPSSPAKAGVGSLLHPTSLPKAASPKGISLTADQLKIRLEAQRHALDRSSNMLTMFLNRCNSAWATARKWGPPVVRPLSEEQGWSMGDVSAIYKADLVRKLHNGMLAFQIFTGFEHVVLPDGARQNLWGSDPWALLEACRPGMMPPGDRVSGMGVGGRVLCNLAIQVMKLAGKDALGKMSVVIHLTEDQEQEITQELWDRDFYGLNRANFVFLIQRKHPGFEYSAVDGFVARGGCYDGDESAQVLGSGHCMAQMAWPSEAFLMDEAGLRRPLVLPVLDELSKRGVEFVVMRRLKDMSTLTKDGMLDASGLAYRLLLREESRYGLFIDVGLVEGSSEARQYGSFFMSNHGVLKSQESHHSGASRSLSGAGLSELPLSDLVTAQLMDAVEGSRVGGRLAVGLGRWIYHLPTLKSVINTPALFRPRMRFHAGFVHVGLDMADISSSVSAQCTALESRHHSLILSSADSMEALIPVLVAQDLDISFREIVVEKVNKRQVAATISAGSGRLGTKPNDGLSIVVFVANNNIAAKAVNLALFLARAGRDTVHLVTVVPVEVQRNSGQELLSDYQKQAVRSMIDVRADVVVRGSHGLLECMEQYVVSECKPGATLAVMGSVELTSNVFESAVGSVTLGFMRRTVGLPVLVVTQVSINSPVPSSSNTQIMVTVEPHARAILNLVCSQILAPRNRGDKLLLAQVQAMNKSMTKQQESNQRRILDNFESLAIGHHTPSSRSIVLHGPMDECLLKTVEVEEAGILALQLPSGSKGMLPAQLRLLRRCRGAVLVYQEPLGGEKSAFLPHSSNLGGI